MSGLYQDELIEELGAGVKSILDLWGLSTDTELSLLCVSENATFRADDPARNQSLVFRVHRPDYHEYDEIVSELDWIDDLRAGRIVETPYPLQNEQGEHRQFRASRRTAPRGRFRVHVGYGAR